MKPMLAVADRVLAGEESLRLVSRSLQLRIDTQQVFSHKQSFSRTFKLANCTWCLELNEKRPLERHVSPFQSAFQPAYAVYPPNTSLPRNYTLNLSLLKSGNLSVHTKFVLCIAHTNMSQSCFSIDVKKHFKSGDSTFVHSSDTLDGIHDKRVVIDFEFLDVKINRSNDKEVAYELPGEELAGLAYQTHLNCLSRMFTESLYADVTINTNSGSLRAHRAVLAATSSVFACMFDNDFKENISSTIDIQDMSFESCNVFLSFLYGVLKEEDLWVHKCSLLEASHKYGITTLQNICEERLTEDINLSNVLERLSQAHLYGLKNLKKTCLDYLFDLGRVYHITDEFTRFTVSAAQGLATEIIRAMLAKVY